MTDAALLCAKWLTMTKGSGWFSSESHHAISLAAMQVQVLQRQFHASQETWALLCLGFHLLCQQQGADAEPQESAARVYAYDAICKHLHLHGNKTDAFAGLLVGHLKYAGYLDSHSIARD